MLNGYGAPLQIYQHLEYHDDTGPGKTLQSIPVTAIDYGLGWYAIVLRLSC
jgi:hypothetical protein